MRILHLNLERSWRGGERQTLFTLLGLQELGHDVALLARTNSALAKAVKAKGIQTYECDNNWAAILKILRIANKYDVLHAQTAQTASLLAFLKPFVRSLLVFTRRTAFTNKQRLKRHYLKWSRMDALVAISAAAAQAPKDMGLAVEIIPSAVKKLAVHTENAKKIVHQYGLENSIVLLTTSALSSEKDPLTSIKTIDLVRKVLPNVVCLHCGADGDAASEAKELVRHLGIEQHYIFAGFQKNIGDFLSIADVYISSSIFEALGTSVLDACLAGVPVVATDTGGHKEILQPDYGLLANVGDADALAKKVIWLLQHQQVALDMAKRAQEMVAEQFSVPAMVTSYAKLYSSLKVLR